MNFLEMNMKVQSLTIFRNILDTPVMKKFSQLLQTDSKNTLNYIQIYCEFVSLLYTETSNFSEFLYHSVCNDENIYIYMNAMNNDISEVIQDSVANELSILQEISCITSKQVLSKINYDSFLPEWETSSYDFYKSYMERIQRLPVDGYGIYTKYFAFSLLNDELVPVKHPDPQRLEDLIGYERERNTVKKNTLAFLQDMQASNVLLYGDAGTGKSSTVKALLNAYHKQGLRLIEVKKHQLSKLPEMIDELATNPLKFIIFIDDLSFSGNDDNFIALKTILEGGVSTSAKNIVIYATTNRRHFVKESMKDRNSDELFTNDSIQETMSLAARFGLTITFQKPNKDLYLDIVQGLAKKYQLNYEEDVLVKKAEAFALRNNGRSPRTAKQFIEHELIHKSMD